jgi:hypothetical protein
MRWLKLQNILFCLLLVSCTVVTSPVVNSTVDELIPISTNLNSDEPWTAADLRAILADNPQKPTSDLIAFYQRQMNDLLQVRFDFLDTPTSPEADIYLSLDLVAGGASRWPFQAEDNKGWDTFIKFPAGGGYQSYDLTCPDTVKINAVSISLDPLQDSLVISIKIDEQWFEDSYPWRTQAFLTAGGTQTILDQTEPVSINERLSRSHGAANLLLAFWNTLPAQSPVQAVRRWSGAHSGPYGERFGLKHLLDASLENKAPITLLDLKHPTTLTALTYLGVIDDIQQIEKEGLLILPDVAYGDPSITKSIEFSRLSGKALGFASSPFLFGDVDNWSSNYKVIFSPSCNTSQQSNHKGQVVIPLPTNGQCEPASAEIDSPATREGLSITARRALLEAARSKDPSQLVILGGDLTQTTWGDINSAAATLNYIANHPWIKTMQASDLLAMSEITVISHLQTDNHCNARHCQSNPEANSMTSPAVTLYTTSGKPIPSHINSSEMQNNLREKLLEMPHNPLSDITWQAYLALTGSCIGQPACATPGYASLRAQYLGQVGILAAAAYWAANPSPQSSCDSDPDLDGIPECILSSTTTFSVYESDGARLTHVFIITPNKTTQIIAPASQLAIGRSDPSEWQPEYGPAGDPADIPGAFSETINTYRPYSVRNLPDHLIFTSVDGAIEKIFSLTATGLLIEYHSNTPLTTRIPFALDLGSLTAPNWRQSYQFNKLSDGWEWKQESSPVIRIQIDGNIAAQNFYTSAPSPTLSEDPNREIPPGDFLPFALAVLEVNSADSFSVKVAVAD